MNRRVREWSGPIVIAAALVALTTWTWGKWPDAYVDFGRELYVPWQMSEGRSLYGHLAYFNGPLSPAVNALLFRVTGPSLRSLVWLNLAVVVAILALAYRLLRAVAGRFAAAVGGLVFLVFFAFAQFMPGGNYNYLAPYSHEATHGLTASLAALACLRAYVESGKGAWAFACGFAAGLAFLTKAEFPIALLPAIGVGLFVNHRADADAGRGWLRASAVVAAGFAIPPVAAFAWLATVLPAGDALSGVAGSWMYLFDERLRALRFYRDIQGTLDVGDSFDRIGAWLARYAAVFVPAAAVAYVIRRDRRSSWGVACAVGAAAIGAALVGRTGRDWENLGRPFPILLAAAIVIIARAAFAARSGDRTGDRSVERRSASPIVGLSCAIFALLLLLKIILHTSLVHYGFVLAMPAALVLVAIAVGIVPGWLDARGGSGRVFQAAVLGSLVGFGVIQVSAAQTWLSQRTVALGHGTDQFLVHRNDIGVANVLSRIEALRAPAETLLVVPEGVMLNYLLRATNPTGVVNFMPPEVIMFGEQRILDSFRAHPPNWVVLMNRPALEYGYRFFGDDYARTLYAWIEQGYDPVDNVFTLNARGQRVPMAAILRHRASRDRARQLE